jgi:hypothetical protein
MSALVGAAMLAGPLSAVAADATPPAATAAQEAPRETVEQRITSLHASLAITPAEERDWSGVTMAMRQNAAVMDKLVAERSAKDPAKMTAVDDLMTYEKFARAHVEGLKSLTRSFAMLYKAMPDAQKKVADDVFQNFGREKPAAHG